MTIRRAKNNDIEAIMNLLGQVLEIHLSLAAKALGFNIATPVFDGADEEDIMDTLDRKSVV